MQYLLKALVLPLLALTIAAMLASVYLREPWSGLFVNLAASFVGAIITVCYIDVVVRRHERKQWVVVKARVEKHVERIANVCVHSIRSALGVEPEAIGFQPGIAFHLVQRRQQSATVAERVLLPMLPAVRNLNEQNWNTLVRNLQGTSVAIDRALGLFGARFDAPMVCTLLELQETADGILAMYSTFQDIYGVPGERLRPKRDETSSIPLQQELHDYAVTELGKLLLQSVRLLRCLDSNEAGG
jgi:hypothetical protein